MSKIVEDYFMKHDKVFVLNWLPGSLELSPIGHICEVVEREIRILDRQPTNVEEFLDVIIKAWAQIWKDGFQNIIEFIPRRIRMVPKAKVGGGEHRGSRRI